MAIHIEFRLTPPRYLFTEYLLDVVVVREAVSKNPETHSASTGMLFGIHKAQKNYCLAVPSGCFTQKSC